eukprot:1567400-Pyramimonas_sp.AAC.1
MGGAEGARTRVACLWQGWPMLRRLTIGLAPPLAAADLDRATARRQGGRGGPATLRPRRPRPPLTLAQRPRPITGPPDCPPAASP